MKISREWLQEYFHEPLPPVEKIADALTFHAFEIDGMEKVGGDDVLDVKITPNRGHDALSHRGIAKEISAILNIPLVNDPLKEIPTLNPTTDKVSVIIEDLELCPRYIAGYIKGVKVGSSPAWLKERLEAIGQKSINNVVDATNFVMFNIGQPLHAFDAGKLTASDEKYAIEVRKAKEGETMIALDEKEYKLGEMNLVICDKNSGVAIGIAGVKGGKASGIDESTHDIIIESANFNGVSVRKTAKALNLATDASQRFQQVLSPELAAYGMRSVVDMIFKIAGGELVGLADAYPKSATRWQVSFTAAHTGKLLGIEVSPEQVRTSLTHLGFSFKEEPEGTFVVEPPFERLDLVIPEDLIEEVGRMIGYEKIPSKTLPPFEKQPEVNKAFYSTEHIREQLIFEGYSEVYTSVFADKGERLVLNKVDGVRPYLRDSLLPGLSDAVTRNMLNRMEQVKLFEIGTIWKGGKEQIMVAKSSKSGPLPEEEPLPLPNETPSHYEDFPLSRTERYKPFSKYPFISRDIALWVPKGTKRDEIMQVIQNSAGNFLMGEPLFFDSYEPKDGKKNSYAFRLVFQSFEKTLTDDEANAAMEAVYRAVKSKGWEVR